MGTFGGYYGNCHIDDEKKEVFNEQMAKILNYGGMMDYEEVKIYGQKIGLLKPFALNGNASTCFFYNYFEDDSWETAKYDPEKALLGVFVRWDRIGGFVVHFSWNRISCGGRIASGNVSL